MNTKLYEEALEWMAEAKHDPAAAQLLYGQKSFAWTCFVSQQAAEKAFKAVLIAMDSPGARCHAITDLADSVQALLAESLPETVLAATGLDLFSVASRYPDAAPGKRAPFRVITDHQADDAVRVAAGAVGYLDQVLTHLKG